MPKIEKGSVFKVHFKFSCSAWWPFSITYIGLFYKEIKPRLAKRPLRTNGRLANSELTSLVKEATWVWLCTHLVDISKCLFYPYLIQISLKFVPIHGFNWWWINIDACNGLAPNWRYRTDKPLHKPVTTEFRTAYRFHQASINKKSINIIVILERR